MRRTELKRTGFKQTPPKEMKRTPLKAKKSLQNRTSSLKAKTPWLPQKKPLKHRSDKMQRIYTEERIPLVKKMLAEFPVCYARIVGVCTYNAVDVHELLSRGRGGSITDPDNCVTICRMCHTWVGENPAEAKERGLLLSAGE